jgi:hypothetical protein
MEVYDMSRQVLSQNMHIVPIIRPWASDAPTKLSIPFSMKDASHATIILFTGTMGGDFTYTVVAGTDFTPSAESAIAFRAAKEETTLGDTLAALGALSPDEVTVPNTTGVMHVIEIDAEDLPEGYPTVQLKLAGLNNTTLVAAVAILSGLCHAGDTNRTQIA